MLNNPFKKVTELKNGTKIEMADDDFEYFESYVNTYNQFENISIKENQDINKSDIRERLRTATNMYLNKEISMNGISQYIKDPKSNTKINKSGGSKAPTLTK